jgi:hypothetical protein
MEGEDAVSHSPSSSEEFHTPRGRDWSEEPEIEWMYADARALPLPGMAAVAAANPLRWSRGTPDAICQELVQGGLHVTRSCCCSCCFVACRAVPVVRVHADTHLCGRAHLSLRLARRLRTRARAQESLGSGWWGERNDQRPVKLRVVGQNYVHQFANSKDAAQVPRGETNTLVLVYTRYTVAALRHSPAGTSVRACTCSRAPTCTHHARIHHLYVHL